jgi:nucleoside-diphosphate-sugar epimerase
MTSYIFGSSGFIGRHLVKRLLKEEHKVIEIHHNQQYQIKKADYIFYLSSYGNHYYQTDKHEIIKANLVDYYDLLKKTKKVDYKNLIYFSSSSVNLPVQTLYSESKLIGELMGSVYAEKYSKNISSIRPYSVYGEGEATFRFIPTVIQCLKNGLTLNLSNGWHDWIYIDDFIDALMEVLYSKITFADNPINIGTGITTSNQEVVELLKEISRKDLKISKDNKNKRIYDTKNWKAEKHMEYWFDWKPKYSLKEGLTKLWIQSL